MNIITMITSDYDDSRVMKFMRWSMNRTKFCQALSGRVCVCFSVSSSDHSKVLSSNSQSNCLYSSQQSGVPELVLGISCSY